MPHLTPASPLWSIDSAITVFVINDSAVIMLTALSFVKKDIPNREAQSANVQKQKNNFG